MILPLLDAAALRELAEPDNLAVLAALHGLPAAPPERATRLELTRDDLAQDVGEWVPPRRQGGEGGGERPRSERGGPEVGTCADYVVALGVVSRIAPAERPRLWRRIAERLAAGGTALVSYDVLPGSLELEPLFRLMRHHVMNVADDALALRQARDVALWHTHRMSSQFGVERGQAPELALSQVRALSDEALLDVLRAPERHALSVSQLAAEARTAGLAWYGNARRSEPESRMLPGLLRAVVPDGGDPVRRQQYLDFFLMTRQRTSLLCHAADVPRRDDPERVPREAFAPMWVASRIERDRFDGAERARIGSPIGEEALTAAATAMLRLLAEAAPAARPVSELSVDPRLGLTRDGALDAVAELWRGDVVRLSLRPPAAPH